MAVCLRNHISFSLMLMTEMWEFVLFHWRTATFHNSFWSFKIAVILEKPQCLSFFYHFFLIGKAISLIFFLPFYLQAKYSILCLGSLLLEALSDSVCLWSI